MGTPRTEQQPPQPEAAPYLLQTSEVLFLNKRCKIIYSDGHATQTRIGTISSFDAENLVVEGTIIIPKAKIGRIELAPEFGGPKQW